MALTGPSQGLALIQWCFDTRFAFVGGLRQSGLIMNDTVILIIIIAVALAAGAFLMRATHNRPDAVADAMAEKLTELSVRLQQLSEGQTVGQAQLSRTIEERLEAVSKRLGDGLTQQTEKTGQALNTLHERLAVIDAAQKNITGLSEQMVGLQDILSNKQARGAFGEIQLNDLVSAVLPPSAYKFQAKLSNARIADCLLELPNPPGSIAIDAKFPLESYQALCDAGDKTAKVQASRAFSADVIKHVRDIAEKYIIPGETAESAFMFLPSEAVYAELHANFRNVIEESFKRRVWIVSPTTLWATLNTVRAVLKDARMREQAGVIQVEVLKLMDDVTRVDDRVAKLQRHFDQAGEDMRQIRISTDKVTRRAGRIDELQLEDGDAAAEPEDPAALPAPRLVE